ncbi:MAG: leucyl aminopeptidase [Bacteriovoracaceae bacterium]|jgi:leucyl aminopeptidase
MEFHLNFNAKNHSESEVAVFAGFSKVEEKGKKKENKLVNGHWPKEVKEAFNKFKASTTFSGQNGQSLAFPLENGDTALAYGLGEKSKLSLESLRKSVSNLHKTVAESHKEISINLDSFLVKSKLEESLTAIVEALLMTEYRYEVFMSKKSEIKLKSVTFDSKLPKSKAKKANEAVTAAVHVSESVNLCRDYVNCPPNDLNSETYAKRVVEDAKKIKGVKVKVLGKADLKKEKMGMFLAVNQGSDFEPQLVHLTYTPPKATKKTKHIALVGKGLTFDTGGLSLKPGASMVNMKTDMAGSSTLYAAFRAAALTGAKTKITCLLGMTDNAIGPKAIYPDAIVKAKNGKTVEILNTDAEGRLVLGDVLTYASEMKPDAIIDAATLTGACLIAVGIETCAILGNNQKLINDLLKSAKNTDEYVWQLPIIEEFHNDMKSPIADLKNIGGSRWGGTAKAAAFLENFVDKDIAWAHLDIAGISGGQGAHKPYCPASGASGLIVRTVCDYLRNA